MSSLTVAPPDRFSKSRILVALLPSRAELAFFAPLGTFLPEVAFLHCLPLVWRSVARTFRAAGLLGGFGPLSHCRALGGTSFFLNRGHVFSFRGDTAVTTWITPRCPKSKTNLHRSGRGDGMAIEPEPGPDEHR